MNIQPESMQNTRNGNSLQDSNPYQFLSNHTNLRRWQQANSNLRPSGMSCASLHMITDWWGVDHGNIQAATFGLRGDLPNIGDQRL